MEFLFTDLFIHTSFAGITFGIIGVALFAYKRGVFFSKIAVGVFVYAVIFVVLLLSRQYVTGHMAEHAMSEPTYIFLAPVHGIISLWAFVQAGVMFFFAHRAYRAGINFFREHKKWTALLVFAWVFSLISGFFL
mgnify:FL=1